MHAAQAAAAMQQAVALQVHMAQASVQACAAACATAGTASAAGIAGIAGAVGAPPRERVIHGMGVNAGGGGGGAGTRPATPAAAGEAEWQRVLQLLRDEQRRGRGDAEGEGEDEAAAVATPREAREAATRMAEFAAARMASGGFTPHAPDAAAMGPQASRGAEAAAAAADGVLPHASPGCGGSDSCDSGDGGMPREASAGAASAGAALRSRMNTAARAKRFQEAHRLLEELWRLEPSLIEPPLLLWAAQRRTTGTRLWWGSAERERSVQMLRRALDSDGLDVEGIRRAAELLAVLMAVGERERANDPAVREMASLQQHLAAWMDGRAASGAAAAASAAMAGLWTGSGTGSGSGVASVGWERPAANAAGNAAAPAHVRKMARRYDALRAALLKAAREGDRAVAGGALPTVAEEEVQHGAPSARPISPDSMLLADDETGPAAEDEEEDEEQEEQGWGGELPSAAPRPARVDA